MSELPSDDFIQQPAPAYKPATPEAPAYNRDKTEDSLGRSAVEGTEVKISPDGWDITHADDDIGMSFRPHQGLVPEPTYLFDGWDMTHAHDDIGMSFRPQHRKPAQQRQMTDSQISNPYKLRTEKRNEIYRNDHIGNTNL